MYVFNRGWIQDQHETDLGDDEIVLDVDLGWIQNNKRQP